MYIHVENHHRPVFRALRLSEAFEGHGFEQVADLVGLGDLAVALAQGHDLGGLGQDL